MRSLFQKFDLKLRYLVYSAAFFIPLSIPATRIIMKTLLFLILVKFIFRLTKFDRIDLTVFSVSIYQLMQSLFKGLLFKFLSKPNGIYPSFLFLFRKVDFEPKTAINIFLFSSFILAVAFIFQAFTGVNVKHMNFDNFQFLFPPVRPDRTSAFLGHPLTVGGILSTAVLFLIGILLRNFSKIPLVVTIAIFFSILLSLDRCYWIGLFVSAGIIAFNIKTVRKLYIAMVISALLCIAIFPNLREKTVATFKFSDRGNVSRISYESSVCRLIMWKSAFQMFSDLSVREKLFGISEVNLKENVKPYMIRSYRQFEQTHDYKFISYKIFNHLHNNLIQFIIAYGLVGTALFVYLFFFILKFNYSAYKRTKMLDFLIFAAVYINWLVAGMFEYNFGDEAVKFLMFLTIAVNVKLFDKIASSSRSGG